MTLAYYIASKIKSVKNSFTATVQKIAVFSIAICMIALILAFTIYEGFNINISKKIFSFSGHLVITKYSLSNTYSDESITIDDSLLHDLQSMESIEHYQNFAIHTGLLKHNDVVHGVIFKGIDATFDTSFVLTNILEGRLPNFNPESSYTNEICVSKRIANYLKLKLNDNIIIYFVQNPPRFRKLQVVGIYESGLNDFDENFILGDINLIKKLFQWNENQVGGIEVFLKNGVNFDDAHVELFESVSSDFYVANVKNKFSDLFDWIVLLNRNVIIFLVLILIVSCFSMISILLIFIMEKTPMIGNLKAMGATNSLIKSIFLNTGIKLILKGLLWGNAFGFLIAFIQKEYKIITLNANNYFINYVPIEFDWLTLVGLNILVFVLIVLSLLTPLAIISQIQPIRAIRFD